MNPVQPQIRCQLEPCSIHDHSRCRVQDVYQNAGNGPDPRATQVAGFNQFYDDYEATDTWVYGVALDQKFPKDVYFGAEFSYRDLDVPFFDLDLTILRSGLGGIPGPCLPLLDPA